MTEQAVWDLKELDLRRREIQRIKCPQCRAAALAALDKQTGRTA